MSHSKVAVRRGMAAAGVSLLMCLGATTVPAHADGPTEIYRGTVKGKVDVLGGGHAWKYKDKQYISTSLRNTRKHSIRVTYKGCKEWRARAAVRYPGSGGPDTDEQTVKGCNKTAWLTVMGSRRSEVTLGIKIYPSGDYRSEEIRPR